MRKIHDVLRLQFGLQLPQRQIARSVRLSQSTIHDYIGRFEQSGLTWPLPDDCDEAKLEWPPSRLVAWAQTAGPFTGQLFHQIMERYPHPEMGYRSCLGMLRLGEKYSLARLEAASERALTVGAASYKSVKSILVHALDAQPLAADQPEERPGTDHGNIRGAGYYQ